MMKSLKECLLLLAPALLLCLNETKVHAQRQIAYRDGVTVEMQPYPFDGVRSVGPNFFTGTNWGIGQNGQIAHTYHSCMYSIIQGYSGQPYGLPLCNFEQSQWTTPGWNRGSVGGLTNTGWLAITHSGINASCYSAGICSTYTLNVLKPSGGDFTGWNLYAECSNSWITGADEGCVGSRNSITQPGMMEGTVLEGAAGIGTQLMSVNCTLNCAMVGEQRPLINKTTGVLSATVTATSTSGINEILTLSGITLPTPSVCGTIAANVQTPGAQLDKKVAGQSIVLTGLPSALTVGQLVMVGRPFIEQTTITSVARAFSGGSETITVPLAFPYLSGGFVCAGGLSGYVMEAPMFTSATSRPVWWVVSSTSTTISVTAQTAQGLGLTSMLYTVPSINLYPAATVVNSGTSSTFSSVANQTPGAPSSGTLTFTIEPNLVTWNTGDSVEIADLPSALYTNTKGDTTVGNILASVISSQQIVHENHLISEVIYEGVNYSDSSNLATHGGKLFAPVLMEGFTPGQSPFGAAVVLWNYPETWTNPYGAYKSPCLLCMEGGWATGTTLNNFDIYRDDVTNQGININPATGKLGFNGLGIQVPAIKALTGTRYVCVDTAGNLVSQTTACSGT